MKDIYSLKLHEGVEVEASVEHYMTMSTIRYEVVKVHGGFLYHTKGETTFVPYPESTLEANERHAQAAIAELTGKSTQDVADSFDAKVMEVYNSLSDEDKGHVMAYLQNEFKR